MAETRPQAGHALLQAGRWEDARAAFQRELALDPTPEAFHGMAEALWWCGDIHESVTFYQRAYLAYRDQGNAIGSAWAAIFLCVTYKNCLGNPAGAAGWLAKAESAVRNQDVPPLPGWILALRGYLESDTDLLSAREAIRRGLEYAIAHHDRDLELVARADLGVIEIRLGNVEEGLRLVDESMAGVSAGEHTRLDTVVFVSCIMLNACELATDFERALQWSQVTDGFVATYGCPFLYAECRSLYGAMLVANGRWSEAEEELRAAIEMAASTYPPVYALAVSSLASLTLRRGSVERAEALLEPVQDEPVAALVLAACKHARGEHSRACAFLERALMAYSEKSIEYLRVLGAKLDIHVAEGDLDAASRTLEQVQEAASGRAWPEARAIVAQAGARVARASGDAITAMQAFETAATCFTQVRMPLEAARARYDIAETCAAANRELAIVEAQAALRTFESLGAKLDEDRAAAFLRSLGVTSKPGPRGLPLLTEREREVLDLLCLGMSNPEIAERLVISRKTAAHHVSHLLAKLGVRNRSEAIALAAHHGIPS